MKVKRSIQNILLDGTQLLALVRRAFPHCQQLDISEFIASWHPVPHYQMELYMKDLLETKMVTNKK